MLPDMPHSDSHATTPVHAEDDAGWHGLPEPAGTLGGAVEAPASRPQDRVNRLGRRGAAVALALILGSSAFLQFCRLDDLQHFQGDEGMLVLAARALVVDHVFPVYGLALAVGKAHIGPLFDYLIALPLWLAGWDPTAAVALNGICQVLAVGLCYRLLVRVGCGRLAGLAAALVYATAQEVVYYARFMWPNMFPCVLLLILWSLLALREGRSQHLALLGIWLGVALQLQPTGVLLVPFLALSLALFRPPVLSARYAMLGLLAFVLLFTPAIIHDLTHGLVETRAWLSYSHHGAHSDRALGPTLARLGVLLQRLLGVRELPLAAALGLALIVGLGARAILSDGGDTPQMRSFDEPPPPMDLRPQSPIAAMAPQSQAGESPRRRHDTAGPGRGHHPCSPGANASTLARLILLLCAVCLLGYLFFGSQLRPHYLMPLFPVPALALGLLVAPWPPSARVRVPFPLTVLRLHGARPWPYTPFLPAVLRGGVVAAALLLAGSNVLHTWQAGFLLDRYQITLRPEHSNRITLGQMRQVSAFIIRRAGGRDFNLLFAAPDDQPFAYQALLLAGGAHLSLHPAALRFLLVQPPDWRTAHWPAWTHRLLACAQQPPARFAAGLIWMVRGTPSCQPSRMCMAGGPMPPMSRRSRSLVRCHDIAVSGRWPAIGGPGRQLLSSQPATNESPPASHP